MKIIGIEMWPISFAFERQSRVAFRGYEMFEGVSEDNVVIRIYTDEGVSGLGESGTWGIYYVGESQESIMATIGNYLFPKVLEGANPFNIDVIHKKMDEAVLGNTCAKAGIDFALYDIMGKTLNVPVYQLLGGCYAEKFPQYIACTYIDEIEKMAENVRQVVANYEPEVGLIKVKVGLEYLKDIKRVEAVRKALGTNHYMLIDCNGSYTTKEAIFFGQHIAEFSPVLLEQPVNYDDLYGLGLVRNNVPIPVAACECAIKIEDIMRVIKMDVADFFNYKVDRLGGLYKGKQALGMINAAGLWALQSAQASIGIGWTALAHFSASSASMFPYGRVGGGGGIVSSLYPAYLPQYKKVDGVYTGGAKIERGWATVPPGPGLGIELDEKALQEWITRGRSPMLVGKKS
jgi:L-alanine-DL-glutamate epimerase-like enolase superfamily enzyme